MHTDIADYPAGMELTMAKRHEHKFSTFYYRVKPTNIITRSNAKYYAD